MIIVLFFSKGIMGEREFSWARLRAFFRDPFGLRTRRAKKAASGGEVNGNG